MLLRGLVEFVLLFIIGASLGLLLTHIGVPPFWEDFSFNPFAWVAITCFALLLGWGNWEYPDDKKEKSND